jgi:hypothetical protein
MTGVDSNITLATNRNPTGYAALQKIKMSWMTKFQIVMGLSTQIHGSYPVVAIFLW